MRTDASHCGSIASPSTTTVPFEVQRSARPNRMVTARRSTSAGEARAREGTGDPGFRARAFRDTERARGRRS